MKLSILLHSKCVGVGREGGGGWRGAVDNGICRWALDRGSQRSHITIFGIFMLIFKWSHIAMSLCPFLL